MTYKALAIIPYVDSADPKWRTLYDAQGRRFEPERFRSWGTLRYLLRGYAKHIPWAAPLLVVQSKSQVPEWYDGSWCVHSDFIPEVHLPTYNSCTIESYLWSLVERSEFDEASYFLYCNDDQFMLRDCSFDDFFVTDISHSISGSELVYGMPKLGFNVSDGFLQNIFRRGVRNTLDVVADGLLVPRFEAGKLLKVTHNIQPICRWQFRLFEKFVYNDRDFDFNWCITKFRDINNINQWAYAYVAYFLNGYSESERKHKFVTISEDSIDSLCDIITSNPNEVDMLCINDRETTPQGHYEFLKRRLLEAFNAAYPDKCKWEK